MEFSGWSRDLILYVSLASNLALLVALYFRTAINEVLRDWWKSRRQRRTEEQDRHHELHKNLGSYSACLFSLMAQLTLLQTAQTPQEVQSTQRYIDETMDELRRINEFITANELRFSSEIRSGLKELRGVSNISEVIVGDYTRIREIGQRVNEVCDRLRKIVEEELGRGKQ